MPLTGDVLGKFRGEIASFLAVKPSPSLVIASLLVSICCGFDIKKMCNQCQCKKKSIVDSKFEA